MTGIGQNYTAIQGSSYAGSLGTGHNPASIVNTPYTWDVTPFAFQVRTITDAVTIHNYSLLTPGAKAEYAFTPGNFSRTAHLSSNINLLNARVSLNRQTAIAGGINIRTYLRGKTSPYNFIDTLSGLESFFGINGNRLDLSGDVTGNSWVEVYGSYARTMIDNEKARLNAGVTLKISRGLAASNVRADNIRVEPQATTELSQLVSGQARYAYSINFDYWKNEKSTMQNIRDFLSRTEGGFSMDLGVEYLLKPSGWVAFDDDDTYYDYDWKIGLSLLDLGFNQYRFSPNSRYVSGIRPGISGADLDNKFTNIENVQAFNDSLATVVRTMRRFSGNFTVINPTRLVINADRFITQAFYVNADLSINLYAFMKDRLYARELNLLTVTPRWETRRWGFYLPMQYNAENKFWVGAAVKAGPLLLGIHNFAYVFAKDQLQNGGGYLALVVRPGARNKGPYKDKKDKRMRQYQCP